MLAIVPLCSFTFEFIVVKPDVVCAWANLLAVTFQMLDPNEPIKDLDFVGWYNKSLIFVV